MSDLIIRAKAGESLTTKQYFGVYVDGSDGENVKLVATDGGPAGSLCLGLLQNEPADDDVAQVAIHGIAKGKAGEALEPFDQLTFNASGKLRKADSAGDHIVGYYIPQASGNALPDAATDDVINVLLCDDKSRRVSLGGSATADLASANTDTNTTTTVTIAGAAVGDVALVSPSAALEAGLSLYAYVSAADTVTVVAVNATSGTVNPASNTFNVIVIKKTGQVIS